MEVIPLTFRQACAFVAEQTAARDLERAQARYDAAKAELNRAKRAWKTALQDAAVAS